MSNLFYIIFLFCLSFFVNISFSENNGNISKEKKEKKIREAGKEKKAIEFPPSIELYFSIKKYSYKYSIPINYAFGIAYKESRYKGPLNLKYNPYLCSNSGALGPMQIMFDTGKKMIKIMDREETSSEITRDEIKNNIDLNVEISMFLIRRLYDKYKNWKLAFGAYNTGSPCVNGYANDVYNFKP